jgi:hypothetical protein
LGRCPEFPLFFYGGMSAEIQYIAPCLVIATVAMLLFILYCVLASQWRRALIVTIYFLAVPALAYMIFAQIYAHAQATLPIDSQDHVLAGPAIAFRQQWNWSIAYFLSGWIFVLGCMQWAADWRWPFRHQPELTSPNIAPDTSPQP